MARGLLLPFKPRDTLGRCALLEAGTEPSPHPVPLRLLHLLWLPLGGEDQTGTKGGDGSLPDGLFGVPHGHKDVVKEGLHLLEEEGGDADGQLTEHQDLGGKAQRDLASGSESSVLSGTQPLFTAEPTLTRKIAHSPTPAAQNSGATGKESSTDDTCPCPLPQGVYKQSACAGKSGHTGSERTVEADVCVRLHWNRQQMECRHAVNLY